MFRPFSVCRGDHWSPAVAREAEHHAVIQSEVEESRGNERGGLIIVIPNKNILYYFFLFFLPSPLMADEKIGTE